MLKQDAADWMPAHASFASVHGNCVIPGMVNLESDEEAGAFDMVSHMLALGHRRILHVGGPVGATGADRRVAGYMRAHATAGVVPPPDHVLRAAFSEEGGRVALQDWLLRQRGGPLPEAVFGANAAIALGCIDVLLARHLRVPADVSVVGFDDSLLARSARMATVQQPLHELGSQAVRVLMDCIDARLDGRGWHGQDNIVLPTTLVPRATLAAPGRKALAID